MDRKASTIRVKCTCCEAVLTVDKVSGEVLFTDKPKGRKVSFEDAVDKVSGEVLFTDKPKGRKVSFEDALMKVKQDQESADDRFKEAFLKEKDHMKVVDQKFEEAMKRKDELDMPIKPIDLD